jgi:hypothetical protein
MHRISRVTLGLFSLWLICFALQGCGGGGAAIQPPPPYTSTVGCGALCEQSLAVTRTLINGDDPATYGIPISCSVRANGHTMNFMATASAPWFTVSPATGILTPGGRTAIGVLSIDATGVPDSRNTGVVTVSAPGFSDNNQMAVELDCSGGSVCNVGYSCDPSQFPIP